MPTEDLNHSLIMSAEQSLAREGSVVMSLSAAAPASAAAGNSPEEALGWESGGGVAAFRRPDPSATGVAPLPEQPCSSTLPQPAAAHAEHQATSDPAPADSVASAAAAALEQQQQQQQQQLLTNGHHLAAPSGSHLAGPAEDPPSAANGGIQ